jgi:hypothetical protein
MHNKLLKHFIEFACKEMGITRLPDVVFTGHQSDNKRTFGYTKPNGTIHVRTTGRHPADVMRTICHELYHYKLNNNSSSQGEEDKANVIAGRIMKKYNTLYPQIFKATAIREEIVSNLAVNNAGEGNIHGIGVGPKGEPGMMPGGGKLRLFKNAMLTRKKPQVRGLRDILNKEIKNEKRQETRNE